MRGFIGRHSEWLRAAGIRAIKTCAQAAIGAIGSATIFGQVDWRVVVSTMLLSGLLSILTSIAGLPETSDRPGT